MKMKSLIAIVLCLILTFSLVSCGDKKGLSYKSNSTLSKPHTANESVQNFVQYSDYSVARIINCGQNAISDKGKVFILFDGTNQNQDLAVLNFSGWNHATNGSATEWGNLKLAGSYYDFNTTANKNKSCNTISTIDIVLLKKIADWNHQHSNGFECTVLAKGFRFADVQNIVFDLKINSSKTKIPTIETIKTIYSNYVPESVVDNLDDAKVNIGITLSDKTNYNASIIFQLDQEVLKDQWIRVIVPANKLSFYQEIDYKKTPKSLNDFSDLIINRLLVVAETKKGSVLRGNIKDWNDNVPETFKEMDLSFKKIEFQLK
ncbi:hypothetical protein [Flavobacterium adhaerens]|uniref:hypothetical protein n=1 Tax=Flavobacterium adhaerens TaxID=3149043 RepID=UPI0032B3AE19